MGAHNCQHIVDPPIADSLCDEAENERGSGNPQSDQECPNTHIPCTVFLEECLRNNSTADCRSRTDEERDDCPTQTHRCIGVAVGASDVADKTANE